MELLSPAKNLQRSGVQQIEEMFPDLHGWGRAVALNESGIPGDSIGLWLVKDGLQDFIGLSTADYLLVPAAHRSIYFVDETEMRTAEDIITNIEASADLNNGGELVGSPAKGYAQYAGGTDESVLRRAYRYFGIAWPDNSWRWSDNTNMEWSDGSQLGSGS